MGAWRLVVGLLLGLLMVTPALVFGSRVCAGGAALAHAGPHGLHHQERSRGAWLNLSTAIVVDVPLPVPVPVTVSPRHEVRRRPGVVSSAIFVPPRG